MNIFAVDESPIASAHCLCDRHVVKMILESAQMLSTAHRVLDGTIKKVPSKSGKRMVKTYVVLDSRQDVLYKSAYVNHPCSQWARKTSDNYMWLLEHFIGLCDEYTYRYGKTHLSYTKLGKILKKLPFSIDHGSKTDFALAMPDEYKTSDSIQSYRDYYMSKQRQFNMVWTKRDMPKWFNKEGN